MNTPNPWRDGEPVTRAMIVAAVAAALLVAGCGGSAALAPAHRHTSKPSAAASPAATSYKDVEALIAAMAVGGALCKDLQFISGGTIQGALSPFATCYAGNTVVVVFTSHASALTYAHRMINVGKITGIPATEVVGPDWAVNTDAAFAAKTVKAIGGHVIQ